MLRKQGSYQHATGPGAGQRTKHAVQQSGSVRQTHRTRHARQKNAAVAMPGREQREKEGREHETAMMTRRHEA